MWRTVVFLAAVLAFANGQSTTVSQCINHPGELPINTYIEGCLTPPCYLPQLEDVVVNKVFRAPRTMTSMQTLATAYMSFAGIEVPINYNLGSDAITCNFLNNSYCPVIQEEVLDYTLRMNILPIFPVGTAVTLEFRIVDQDQQPVVCIRLPIQIDPPLDTARIA